MSLQGGVYGGEANLPSNLGRAAVGGHPERDSWSDKTRRVFKGQTRRTE